MQAFFQHVLDIVAQNPMLAVWLAFVVSVAEAVLVIGFFVLAYINAYKIVKS